MNRLFTLSLLICLFFQSNTLLANFLSLSNYQTQTYEINDSLESRKIIKDNPCPRKKKKCQGTRIWEDGSSYKGDFRYGEPHGNGFYLWSDGGSYTGEFLDGYRHGKGKQSLSNGDSYTGEWRYGLMHGHGEYRWEDGSIYIGQFVAGLMEGEGTINLANGESYKGEWRNGLVDGQGTFCRIDGSKYTGRHKNGERHGKGLISWKTGDVFTGSWKNGRLNKIGTFQFANGDQLVCKWDDGEMIGEAAYIINYGRSVKGNLLAIERHIMDNPDLTESAMANLGLSWYTLALEYKAMKKYDLAAATLRNAQKHVVKSSDLAELIHQQLRIVKDHTKQL